MWKVPGKRLQRLKVQGVDGDADLEPLSEPLKDHLSKSGILSLAPGSILWLAARVTLAAWLGSRKGQGCLPDLLSPLVF